MEQTNYQLETIIHMPEKYPKIFLIGNKNTGWQIEELMWWEMLIMMTKMENPEDDQTIRLPHPLQLTKAERLKTNIDNGTLNILQILPENWGNEWRWYQTLHRSFITLRYAWAGIGYVHKKHSR